MIFTIATGSSGSREADSSKLPCRKPAPCGFRWNLSNMRLTLIHPCIGRRKGQRYIRTWQMEPLPAAVIAGLTPPGVEVRFYDDRMERIPFDEPTDVVAISVETYTAKRAYQIASEYRQRGVPVIMGGFHATPLPRGSGAFCRCGGGGRG